MSPVPCSDHTGHQPAEPTGSVCGEATPAWRQGRPHLLSCPRAPAPTFASGPLSFASEPQPRKSLPGSSGPTAPQTQKAPSRIRGVCLASSLCNQTPGPTLVPTGNPPSSLRPWHPSMSAQGSPIPPCSPASPPTSGPRTGKLLHDAAEQPGAGGAWGQAAALPPAPRGPRTPGGQLHHPTLQTRVSCTQTSVPAAHTPVHDAPLSDPGPNSCLLSAPPHPGFLPRASSAPKFRPRSPAPASSARPHPTPISGRHM